MHNVLRPMLLACMILLGACSSIPTVRLPAGSRPCKSVIPPRGDLYLLCVGIAQYRDPSWALTWADQDAASIEQIFSNQRGRVFRQIHTTRLQNFAATKAVIISALKAIAKKAGADDVILVTISSHGDTVNTMFSFMPNDIDDSDDERRQKTCVPLVTMLDILAGSEAKKLIFFDACMSGAVFPKGKATRRMPAPPVGREHDPLKYIPGSLLRDVAIFSSCRFDELSYECKEYGNGLYSRAISNGLCFGEADQNRDQIITTYELKSFVETFVPNVQFCTSPSNVREEVKDIQHPIAPIDNAGNLPLYSQIHPSAHACVNGHISEIGASSTLDPSRVQGAVRTYDILNILDGNLATTWATSTDGGVGERITLRFDRAIRVWELHLCPGFAVGYNAFAGYNRVARVRIETESGHSDYNLANETDNIDFHVLKLFGARTDRITITILGVYPGSVPNVAISELVLYGQE